MSARAALIAVFAITVSSVKAQLYQENFETDPSQFWATNTGPSFTLADFFFDYTTVGIPAAPSGAGTRGLKLQANLNLDNDPTQENGTFGGLSVSPLDQDFSAAGNYKLTFDWWANFHGPFPGGGNGSTQLSIFGVGTAGLTPQWQGGNWDSVFFGATGDGGSTNDWRAYSRGALTSTGEAAPAGSIWPETSISNVYAAGNVAGVTQASHPYYASLGSNSAPAVQLAAFPQQTGTTAAGAAGMEWHQVEIIKSSTDVKWTVDGTLIAAVPLSEAVIMGGGNILFGHSDINLNWSTDANHDELLFTLIDNVAVVDLPETPTGDADFDGDDDIDGEDFLTWQQHVGQAGDQTQGDADGNGQIEAADLEVWKLQFGNPPPAVAAVPEPATWALIVAAALGAIALARPRRRRLAPVRVRT